MAAAVIPWAEIEQSLRQWVVASTEIPDGRVIWGWPSHPQPPMPFAWLQITTGLGHVGSPETVRVSQTMRDRITVTGAAEGPYTARIYEATPADETGVPYTYDAADGQDIEQIRDGWASVLDGSPYTVTVDEDDAILVAGTEEHPHFHLVIEEGQATRETEVDALGVHVISVDRFTLRLQVQAEMGPGQPAMDLLSRAALSLRAPAVRRGLHAVGIARARTWSPVNINKLIEDRFASRGAQDFQFNALAHIEVEQTPWVRTAETTGTVVGGGP